MTENPTTPSPLTEEQLARCAALRAARAIVAERTGMAGTILTPGSNSDLIRAARFILTGDEFYGVPDEDEQPEKWERLVKGEFRYRRHPATEWEIDPDA